MSVANDEGAELAVYLDGNIRTAIAAPNSPGWHTWYAALAACLFCALDERLLERGINRTDELLSMSTRVGELIQEACGCGERSKGAAS